MLPLLRSPCLDAIPSAASSPSISFLAASPPASTPAVSPPFICTANWLWNTLSAPVMLRMQGIAQYNRYLMTTPVLQDHVNCAAAVCYNRFFIVIPTEQQFHCECNVPQDCWSPHQTAVTLFSPGHQQYFSCCLHSAEKRSSLARQCRRLVLIMTTSPVRGPAPASPTLNRSEGFIIVIV